MLGKRQTLMVVISFMCSAIVLNFSIFKFPDDAQVFGYIMMIMPILELFILIKFTSLRNGIVSSLLSWKGLVLLFSVTTIWEFILLIDLQGRQSIYYEMQIIYYPGFFEQVTFSMLGTEGLGLYFRRGTSLMISVLFYFSYYLMILLNSLSAYQGVFAPYFILDIFGISSIYVACYGFSKSIYLAIIIQVSLLLLEYFIPPLPSAFFYTFVPS